VTERDERLERRAEQIEQEIERRGMTPSQRQAALAKAQAERQAGIRAQLEPEPSDREPTASERQAAAAIASPKGWKP
jgi:hypothetical protein